MIFTERQITVRKGKATIDEPVILYRGDYEVSIKFTIMESKFRFKSGVNLVDSEKASHGQLAILAPYGGNVFSEVVKCEDGTVTFTLTKEMIDQLEEVGLYSFQIRLFDYYRESRVSIPPVEFGIEVREPVASEDHDNEVNNAIVGYSIAKVVDGLNEDVPDTFDSNGQYNKTDWETGDRISEGKLNKIEDAIDKINQNEINDKNALNKQMTSNFNVLQNQIDNLVIESGNSDAEVVQARGEYNILNQRLNAMDETDAEFVLQLEEVNAELLDIRIGADGITYDTAGDSIREQFKYVKNKLYRYPFEKSNTFQMYYNGYKNVEDEVLGAIREVKVYTKNKYDVYFITQIARAWGNNKVYYLSIGTMREGKIVEVAKFEKWNLVENDGYSHIVLSSINNSGITCEVLIDWSKITNGAWYTGGNLDSLSLLVSCNYSVDTISSFFDETQNIHAKIKNSVKKVKVYNADPTKKYFLKNFQYSWGVNNISQIQVSCCDEDGSNAKLVASTTYWGHVTTGIEHMQVLPTNRGNYCEVVVDWGKFEEGESINLTYETAGLSDNSLDFNDRVDILLPSTLYGIVDEELNVYFDNIIETQCNNFTIDVACDIGKQYVEKYTVNNAIAIEKTLTISIIRDGKVITKATSTIKIADKKNKTLTALYIGDSNTANGKYIKELKNLMVDSEFMLLGTWEHEGRGSWNTNHYANLASHNGSSNPFYNADNEGFDFAYYMQQKGYDSVDFVNIQLGTNDIFAISISDTIQNLKRMISSIRSFDANIKIGISLVTPPSATQDGWGITHSCSHTRDSFKSNAQKINKAYIDNFDNDLIPNVYINPININIDCVNGFPTQDMPLHSRTTKTITRIVDNVHFNDEGYNQIADSHYYFINQICI